MPYYRKKSKQYLEPWEEYHNNISGLSISDADKANGSPKKGDMIAVNSKDRTDIWLVSEKFFKDNYEIIEGENQ